MSEKIIHLLSTIEIRKSEVEDESDKEKLGILLDYTNQDIITFINLS